MAVRIRVRIERATVAHPPSVETVAVANSGFEAVCRVGARGRVRRSEKPERW